MKNKILLFASLMLTLASCSKNDDPVVVPPTTSPPTSTVGDDIITTYVNLGSTNIWTYDTTKAVVLPLPAANTIGTDVLNVSGDFIANGFNYKSRV